MCPICGTVLELSEAPQAERERAFIRRRIDQGQSKEEIKDALVAEYGPEVLATPEGSGFDLAAWLIPGLGIGLVLAAAGYFAYARRRAGGGPGPDAEPLTPEETRRLDSDLARYDT